MIIADALDGLRAQLAANALPGITIARMVGHWGWFDSVPTTGILYDYRVAFLVAGQGAFATSINVPYVDEGDFMYVDDSFREFGTSTPDWGNVHIPFDIRAMRKIEEIDDTLFFIMSNAGADGTAQVYMRARILALLP